MATVSQDARIKGALSYVLGFLTGGYFLLTEKKNAYIRFHAAQSVLVSLVVIGLNFVLGFIPFVGWIVLLLLPFAVLVLWVYLMYVAYQGKKFMLPYIGPFAQQIASGK